MISSFRFPDITPQRRAAGGAMLFIRLDLAGKSKDRRPGYIPGQKAYDAATANAPRILIVEDVLMAAWHLESLVHDLNFDLGGLAANGEEAIERADDLKPNVLLMDINLGKGMDGIEAARRICETVNTAVVFISAYTDDASLDRIKQTFPAAPVLAKPVTLEALRAAIAAVCKTKHD
jgi:CheY-like chemotaxis protein